MDMNAANFQKAPASALQKQFWLIHQMAPNNSAYNIVEAFHLGGDLDVDALERAVCKIIERHEIFRTFLAFEGDVLMQYILPEVNFKTQFIELDDRLGDIEHINLYDILVAEARKPFDLGKCPLMRMIVVRRSLDHFTLMFVFHHSIADLETIRLFAEELDLLYANCAGRGDLVPEFPKFQYKDYAFWQQEWLKGPKLVSQATYWREILSEISGFLELPSDKKRPVAQTLEGSAHELYFDHVLIKRLEQFSRVRDVNLFLTMLTAYIVLLYRYSGQNDVVVGVPLTNRREGFYSKKIMGCFVNTMPLALHVERSDCFKDVLQKVRSGLMGAYRNQEIPLEAILNEVKPSRNASYNPLFQVGFTFAPPMPLRLADLDVESFHVHPQGSQLDMFATLWESECGGMKGYLEYSTALFEDWRMRSFADNYKALLGAVLDKEDLPVAKLPIVAESEMAKMKSWNATDANYDVPDCLHRWVELQAWESPDDVAVVYKNNALRYRELDQRANQLAAFLSGIGVGPETLVGVFMDRCPEMVVALLGILKAGGAYVPLDPDFPKDRIAYMLEHSAAALVLTKKNLASDLPDSDTPMVCIDSQWSEIGALSKSAPNVAVTGDHLAYVIYTSGSTGKPKGVQISHGAVVNFLASMARKPGIDTEDVLIAVTTLSFDISVLEIFLPLVTGAKTVIVSRSEASDGKLLRDALEKAGGTLMQATPATWRLLLAAEWKAPAGFKALCGGEPLPDDLAYTLVDKADGVWNMYGPTETTIWSTCCHISDKNQRISIGKPIGNTKTYLLDAELNPVPCGVLGELFIGGAGVARGYLNAPELTMERFLEDPFSEVPNARMYRTGDWCRFMQDGNIEFFSRIDNQVKVQGFRIELGEVESTLNQHPQVLESAASVHEAAGGNKRLVGYVVPLGDSPASESLREFMLARLPYYMVPNLFIPVEQIPLTPNAKIDRKALSPPDTKRPELDELFVAPADEFEEKMAAIWRDLLNIDHIGVHDNFFVLGGNSMLSVQMIGKMREEFKCDIRVAQLFQFPTIRMLAGVINQKGGDAELAHCFERANLRKQAYTRRRALGRKNFSSGS